MVIRITGGKSLYGALKYDERKISAGQGQVLFTNEIGTVTGLGRDNGQGRGGSADSGDMAA